MGKGFVMYTRYVYPAIFPVAERIKTKDLYTAVDSLFSEIFALFQFYVFPSLTDVA